MTRAQNRTGKTRAQRARRTGLAGLGMATVVSLAWGAVSFNPSSGVGIIGRGDVITYVGKVNLVANPVVAFEETVALSQNCSKIVNNLPRQATATVVFQRKRVITTDAQVPAPGKEITAYVLKGYTGDVNQMPFEICSSTIIQGEPGWMAAGSLTSMPTGQGLLTFNGKAIPY